MSQNDSLSRYAHRIKLELMHGQLLGEILLDRKNYTIMTAYISEPDNLKLVMNLLRDKSKNIQFEAFHVFKVRVVHVKGKSSRPW